MGGGNQFGFSSSAGPESRSRSSSKSIPSVNSQMYRKEVADKGITWLLLSSTSSVKGIQYYESIIEEVASSLQGAIKVSVIIICYFTSKSALIVLYVDHRPFSLSGGKNKL